MTRTVQIFFFKGKQLIIRYPNYIRRQKVCEKGQEGLFAEYKSKRLVQQAAVGSLIHCSLPVNPLEPKRKHFLKGF